MATNAQTNDPSNYDSRWFIWTIVFLVVSGISLVSYILLSDNGTSEAQAFSKVELAGRKSK